MEMNLIKRVHDTESSTQKNSEELLNVYLIEFVIFQENIKLKLKTMLAPPFIPQDEFLTC